VVARGFVTATLRRRVVPVVAVGLVHTTISNSPPLLSSSRLFLDLSQIYARQGLKWLFGLCCLASSKWAKILPLISIVVLSCIN
jgi:hypothetical protein